MRYSHRVPMFMLAVLLVAGVQPALHAQEPLTAEEQQAIAAATDLSKAFAAAARVAGPGVVNISTTTIVAGRPSLPFGFFGRGMDDLLRGYNREVHSLGSGCLISAEGHILTNNHVVQGATEIRVTLADEREFAGRVLGADPAADLAVVKIDGAGLPYLRWGDSQALQVGEWVVAIGSPFGLARTVTSGIVSATGRTNVGIIGYEDLIQTDAAINPGNSGGPLVNLRGELVGINTAIASRTGTSAGVGFAVPSNMARRIARELIESGAVTRGWIGIIPRELSETLISRYAPGASCGVFVEAIYRQQSAALAGIQPGDVITHWGGTEITCVSQLAMAVADAQIGANVEVRLIRGREPLTVSVCVAQQPRGQDGQAVEGV